MNNFDSPPRVINKTDRTYPPRKLSIALILIKYNVQCADGHIAECVTWTSGPTAKEAFKRWTTNRVNPAEDMATYSVLTEPGNGIIYDTQKPVGKRIKIRDELLEQAAVGL